MQQTLEQLDASIDNARERMAELGNETEALTETRQSISAEISLAAEQYRSYRVRAKAEGSAMPEEGAQLGEHLGLLQQREAGLVAEALDCQEARELLQRQVTELEQQRMTRLKGTVYPQYEKFTSQTETDLLQAVARRLVCIARSNGVPVGATNPQRIVETVLGRARSERTFQGFVDQAIEHFKTNEGMEA